MPYAITIFISAFFIFQVQPIIARFILPWYGGSPAVWSTCMLFFQVGLFIGYVYAHLMARLIRPRHQVLLHGALLAISLALLPITPDPALKPEGNGDPVLGIIRLLLSTVGAPYVLISSTGPLVQHWYSLNSNGTSPYRLYVLSNIGSLLGLITYPFWVEPNMVLRSQTIFWSFGYSLFVAACLWSGRSLWNGNGAASSGSSGPGFSDPGSPDPESSGSELDFIYRPMRRDPFLWVGLSACGSIMLLAVTAKITQDISVIPFLWVLPLCLYLTTFIIAFDSPKWYRRQIWLPAFLLSSALIAYLLQPGTRMHILAMISLYSFAMFCVVMVCHGEMVRRKPPAERLTFFYLMVSLGGALGGAFVSFVATRLFPAYWELQVGVTLALVLVGISLFGLRSDPPVRWRSAGKWTWSGFGVVVAGFLAFAMVQAEDDTLTTRRNFYGVLRVKELDKGDPSHRRKLYSGRINHGAQLLHPAQKGRILSYYSAHSGIGIAIRRHPKRLARFQPVSTHPRDRNLRVGVVGLGVGVLASWGRPGDSFRFYEINPEVVRISNEYFSLMRESKADVVVVRGDGRISLERELREQGSMKFDILAVDAFSGDAIPVHLITREALELYFSHLREDGILALHISNRHIDLEPVVYGLARAMGIPAILIDKDKRPEDFINGSNWILLTKNEAFLRQPEVLEYVTPWPDDIRDDILWTDDFSSLFEVLK